MNKEEILEEARIFTKAFKNFLWFLVVLGCIIVTLSLSSCARFKTTNNHTRDTVYIYSKDTTKGVPKDSLGPEKAHAAVDTVFKEIEKDCPGEEAKLPALKKKIKDAETIEKKTGGSISLHSDKFGTSVLIKFKGDEMSGVFWDGREEVIEDKTEVDKVKQISLFRQILNTWFMWLPPWLLITMALFLRFRK